MSNRKMLLICSFFFLIVTIGLLILSFKTKSGLNFNALLTLSLSVLSFNVWYVYPHINKHDERAQFIKRKTINYTYLFILLYLVLFFILSRFLIKVQVSNLIILLISFIIITLSFTMAIVAKKN